VSLSLFDPLPGQKERCPGNGHDLRAAPAVKQELVGAQVGLLPGERQVDATVITPVIHRGWQEEDLCGLRPHLRLRWGDKEK